MQKRRKKKLASPGKTVLQTDKWTEVNSYNPSAEPVV